MKLRGSTIFTALVAVVMALALFEARKFPFGGRLYPGVAGGLTLIFTLALVVRDIVRARSPSAGAGPGRGAAMDLGAGEEPAGERVRGFAAIYAWALGLWLSTWLFGWLIGLPVFFVAYLVLKAGARWFQVVGLTALMLALMFTLDTLLRVYWPDALLSAWLGRPLF